MNSVIKVTETELKNMLYNSVVNAIQNNLGYLMRHPNQDEYDSMSFAEPTRSPRPNVTFSFDKNEAGELVATLTVDHNPDA